MKHTSEEIKYRLSDLGVQIGNIAIEYITELEKENAELKERIKTLTIHDTNAVLSGLEMKVLKESHRDRANKTQGQLTKAKELLRDVLPYIDLTDCVNSDPRLVLYDKIESLIEEEE